MKAIILTTVMFMAANAMAFEVNLSSSEKAQVSELVKAGATEVRCQGEKPRCILIKASYGIQYPGQDLSEVEMSNLYDVSNAINRVKELKEVGLCE